MTPEAPPPLTLKVVKGAQPGVWIGQVQEIPGIIVQSDSKEGVVKEAADSLFLYVKAYPEAIFRVVDGRIVPT